VPAETADDGFGDFGTSAAEPDDDDDGFGDFADAGAATSAAMVEPSAAPIAAAPTPSAQPVALAAGGFASIFGIAVGSAAAELLESVDGDDAARAQPDDGGPCLRELIRSDAAATLSREGGGGDTARWEWAGSELEAHFLKAAGLPPRLAADTQSLDDGVVDTTDTADEPEPPVTPQGARGEAGFDGAGAFPSHKTPSPRVSPLRLLVRCGACASARAAPGEHSSRAPRAPDRAPSSLVASRLRSGRPTARRQPQPPSAQTRLRASSRSASGPLSRP
jgi:hypothetical protein